MPKTNFGACFEMGKVEALTQMRYASTEKDNAAYFFFFYQMFTESICYFFHKVYIPSLLYSLNSACYYPNIFDV